METGKRWTTDEARNWQNARPWVCGFNYLPRTSVNSTDMWQAETFDLPTIGEELALAQTVGFNACRVFLPFLVWDADPDGFLMRMEQFLSVASDAGITAMPIFFDDCAFAGLAPYLGPQQAPTPFTHNSGWTPSPGFRHGDDTEIWPRLREYVTSITRHFAGDERVLCWDVYNEPGNSERGDKSLPLLAATFEWVRSTQPSQPLTCGTWDDRLTQLNEFSQMQSDVISFHRYSSADDLQAHIDSLRSHDRPLICTEWMSRQFGSRFATHLPIFKREQVGAIHWGLVNGKTQTHFPWGWNQEKQEQGEPEWFHDVFRADLTPYHRDEIQAIKQATGAA